MYQFQFQDQECPGKVRQLLAETEKGGEDSWEAWCQFARECGQSVFSEILFHFTRMEFESGEARNLWHGILLHRETLARSQGRDVSLATAVCDYFLHEKPAFEEPMLVESKFLALNEEFAFHDELTGLHNRRAFNRELAKELERSRRSRQPFSLLMIDVDYFKGYNDSFGHPAGDAALRQLATVLSRTARIVDQVSRYGGEEFAVILPSTCAEKAPQVAERHRKAVAEHCFGTGVARPRSLTISIGTATCPTHANNEKGLVAMADRALYRAKEAGRNCIRTSSDDLRRFPRVPLKLPGECRVDDDRPVRLKGRTVNISLSGMLYEARRPIKVGTPVKAVLRDPETGSRLPLHALSVRLLEDEYGAPGRYYIGMEFEQEKETRDLLEQLLEEQVRVGHA